MRRLRSRRRHRPRTPILPELVWLLLSAAIACGSPPVSTDHDLRQPAAEPPAQGELCADVGAVRLCWRAETPRLVPRVLPPGAAPPQGYRCGGAGAERVCEDRGRNASAFSCGTQRCLQQRPRMPDDGEWECVELSGVVYCHSRGAMAGASPGPADLGWLCGARARAAGGERICVDLDADRPSAEQTYRCRFELQQGVAVRSCATTRGLSLGSACAVGSACPDMLTCQAGLCLPTRPNPTCWLDVDCEAAERCTLGTCIPRSR